VQMSLHNMSRCPRQNRLKEMFWWKVTSGYEQNNIHNIAVFYEETLSAFLQFSKGADFIVISLQILQLNCIKGKSVMSKIFHAWFQRYVTAWFQRYFTAAFQRYIFHCSVSEIFPCMMSKIFHCMISKIFPCMMSKISKIFPCMMSKISKIFPCMMSKISKIFH